MPDPTPVIRSSDSITYESVAAADGLNKGVLLDERDGTPNFSIRRFTLEPGATVPKHTNDVEHEQYVLSGTYSVGIGDEVTTVSEGDALFIPAGVVHWYENHSDETGAFICVVPNGNDEITVIE